MVVSGGRSPDGSEDIFEQEARVAVELAVNADADALLEKFREERGQNDRTAEGPRATFSALAMADVAVRAASAPAPASEWSGPAPAWREASAPACAGAADGHGAPAARRTVSERVGKGTLPVPTPPRSQTMVDNLDDLKGRAKEAAGDLTDNDELKREGKVDQGKGEVKEAIDKIADKFK